MCFANLRASESTLEPLYNPDGEIIEQQTEIYVPDEIHEHVDSVFLNRDLENGILGFMYETSYAVIVVWTSEEAQLLCMKLYDESHP